jgi:chemotaxis protein MotA
MDISTIAGVVIGFGALAMSVSLEGGSLAALWSVPAFVIVMGGTLGAALISFPTESIIGLPKLIMQAFKGPKSAMTPVQVVSFFVDLANKARREGLLSLEEEGAKVKDDFMRKGIQLIVDGVDPKVVREILETDAGLMGQRHTGGYSVLDAMGGFAPTMGIIGTVMGLVNVLGNLAEPGELGPAIAVAFIATLYGVGTANLLWLPLGSKLKRKSEAEVYLRELMTEGILSVQAGDNPRIVKDKLDAFLAPAQRKKTKGKG